MAQKRQVEEPQRETIRAFESLRGTYVIYDSNGAEIAFLNSIEGATVEDVQSYANQDVPGAERIEEVPEVLYRRYQEPKWTEAAKAYRLRGYPDTTVQRQVITEYLKRFVGMQRFSVRPIDPARRQAFHAVVERERQHLRDVHHGPTMSNVDPEVQGLLDERQAIDDKLTTARSRVTQEQHARHVRRCQAAAENGKVGG